jgi:hypothetical protein
MRQPRRAARRASFAALALLAMAPQSCAKAPPPPLVPADYATWSKTTDRRLDYPIPGHEDRLRVIRMNAVGMAYRPSGPAGAERWDFPAGTVIAKEIYPDADPAPGTAPIMVTAMVKAPGDPRAQAGWIWVVKDLASGGEKVFDGNFCLSCHEGANEAHPYGDGNPGGEYRDLVFYPPKGEY